MSRAWHWVGTKIRKWRNLLNEEDLQDAQEHRGDYHEYKANPGAGGGGGLLGGGGAG
jgi:hypothetical protein